MIATAAQPIAVGAGDEVSMPLAGDFAGDVGRSEHAVCTPAAARTGRLAAPVGPFSVGVGGAGLLFLSGQDPATGRLIDGDVVRQTCTALLHQGAAFVPGR